MEEDKNPKKFILYEMIYSRITIFMIILSVILAILGYMFVQAVTSAPIPVIYLATALFYYHIAHFFIGISFLIYYMTRSKIYARKIKLTRLLLSIIFTPASLIVIYIAVLLLSLSSCVE